MAETEGVIKYRLDFISGEPTDENLQELNFWRSVLHGLALIGQDPARYEGYGFGNLSMRSRRHQQQFIISASQTGELGELTAAHYCCIERTDIETNYVRARGPMKPSSEALTHAMFYQLNPAIRCVIHVHSPELWTFAMAEGYPCTDRSVEYGTQQMASEIARLYRDGSLAQSKTLAMAGHEDGVICFGDSIQQAGLVLVSLWVEACQNPS